MVLIFMLLLLSDGSRAQTTASLSRHPAASCFAHHISNNIGGKNVAIVRTIVFIEIRVGHFVFDNMFVFGRAMTGANSTRRQAFEGEVVISDFATRECLKDTQDF
ncbi:hypothetical protein MSAN_00254400 [Mycena sanguinolenta]|uniref:Secreted protein n=1 Tax=Mycena sanguinolenta TaxID=230812 RepID=A0A8H6ZMQ2_9AGAR|nr:hypothetical protein MSAN_00254400 [Mycena sanguinolenta]